MANMGKESKKRVAICICMIWDIHFVVSLKLTQHCKSAVLEKRENIQPLPPWGISPRRGEGGPQTIIKWARACQVTTVGYVLWKRGCKYPVKVDDGSGWGGTVTLSSSLQLRASSSSPQWLWALTTLLGSPLQPIWQLLTAAYLGTQWLHDTPWLPITSNCLNIEYLLSVQLAQSWGVSPPKVLTGPDGTSDSSFTFIFCPCCEDVRS